MAKDWWFDWCGFGCGTSALGPDIYQTMAYGAALAHDDSGYGCGYGGLPGQLWAYGWGRGHRDDAVEWLFGPPRESG